MRRGNSFLLAAVGVAMFGVIAMTGIQMLDVSPPSHNASWNTRVNFQDLGALLWTVSPIVVLACLCAWWRRSRLMSRVGLLAMAVAAAMIACGALIDHLNWRDRPYPQNQVTYLGTFFGFLGAIGVCLAYGLFGASVWAVRRRRSKRSGVSPCPSAN